MKKYLMTGIAALAMCIGFTSCSHDITPMTQEEIDQLEAQKIVNDYEAAFVKAFGQPAANQTWGFDASATRTRGHNANANEWGDPTKEYGNWVVIDALTDQQKLRVKAYFQAVQYPGGTTCNYTDFFVQQVYKGNPQTKGAYSDEEYTAANGGKIIGSEHMDHLTAGSIHDHINNFNYGDATELNVLETNESVNGGKTHKDKIMLMVGSQTDCFGYWNSDGSLGHDDRYRLVSAKTIDDWAKDFGNNIGAAVDDHWDRHFIGFDFDQVAGPDVYAKGVWDPNRGWLPDEPKTWHFDVDGKDYPFLDANTNMYCADRSEKTFDERGGEAHFPTGTPDNATISQLLSLGYLPYTDTLKDWVKVGGCADGYYSDWIVTIAKAEKIGEVDEKDPIRVFAEDLTAKPEETVSEIDQNSPSDWDFNDVVFDAQYVDATHAKITLWAAGGTMPLQINSVNGVLGEGGCEVHKKFQVSVKTMVNTHADLPERSWKDNVPEKVFTITIPQSIIAEKGGNFDSDKYKDNFPLAVRDLIRIEVQKDNRWYELTAAQGKPACKIATPASKVKWLKEKVDIRLGYPTFKQYVGYPSVNWWSGPEESCLYNIDGNSVQCKVCTNN